MGWVGARHRAHRDALIAKRSLPATGCMPPPAIHGHSERPSYSVGSSLCHGLPGFSSGVADHYPIRSPLVVADFLIHNAEGKTFAEIGTRNGDVSKCVAQFTKRAFAVEMEASYCARLVQRGIEVECMRFERVPDKRLVGVDVFYWFVWPPELSEGWLRRLWTLPRADNASATVLVAFDGHIPEDMRFLPLFVAHYGGSVERIFFDEDERGVITSGRRPSYSHDFLYRPGRWGVIHIAKLILGGQEPRPLPDKLAPRLVRAIHENVRTGWNWAAQGWKPGSQPLPSSMYPPQKVRAQHAPKAKHSS